MSNEEVGISLACFPIRASFKIAKCSRCLLPLVIGWGLVASQPPRTAQQVLSDVGKLLDEGASDKKIAHYVQDSSTTDCVNGKRLSDLLKERDPAPRTRFALDMLVYRALYLPPAVGYYPERPTAGSGGAECDPRSLAEIRR